MSNIEKYNEFEATLKKIELTANFIPDASNKDGYDKSKRIALDGRKAWNAVDKTRKDLGSDARKMVDQINTEGKEYLSRIDTAINPHLQAYKDQDANSKREKEEFEQKLTDRIAEFCIPVEAHTMNSDELRALIEGYKSNPLENFYTRTIEAGEKRNSVVGKLTEIRATKIIQEEQAKAFETQQAELERQREEQARAQAVIDERNRIEAERLAAEQERLHAGQRAKEQEERERGAAKQAKEQAQLDARAAIDKANREAKEVKARAAHDQEQAVIAERQRIESEQKKIADAAEAERKKAEKKAAGKRHQASINNKALAVIMSAGIDEKKGKEVIAAIIQSKCNSITINY